MHPLAIVAETIRERLAMHRANLAGWQEPDGCLCPTEPDPRERELVRERLRAAIRECERHLEAFAEFEVRP